MATNGNTARELLLGPLGGANAFQFADGQVAPNGFHWEFIADDADGSHIVDDATGQPVVDLVAN